LSASQFAKDIAKILALLEQYALRAESLDRVPNWLAALEAIIGELVLEVSRANDRHEKQIDLIYQALLLIYGNQLHSTKAKSLFDTIQLSTDKMALFRALGEEVDTLRILNERASRVGGVDHLSISDIKDIDRIEKSIARLREEIKRIDT